MRASNSSRKPRAFCREPSEWWTTRRILDTPSSGRNGRCRAYVGHLKRLLGSGAKALATNAIKGALRSVVCGAVMTNTKASSSATGRTRLARCAASTTTRFVHRAWECAASEGVRHEHTTKELIAEAKTAGPDSAFFATSLIVHPAERQPQPTEHSEMRWWKPCFSEAAPRWTTHIQVDGSCLQHAVPELCRAGWSVVATDAEGFAVAGACGPVPRDLPQTVVTAEHLANEEPLGGRQEPGHHHAALGHPVGRSGHGPSKEVGEGSVAHPSPGHQAPSGPHPRRFGGGMGSGGNPVTQTLG